MTADDHDVRVLLRTGAGPDADEPDLAAIGRRRRQLTRRRRLAGGVAAVVVLPLLGLALGGLLGERRVDLAGPPSGLHEGSTVFPLPDPGEAEPGWLPDHTPIFVVHDRDGDVHVVRALSPYAQGIDVAVAWCEPAQAFLSVFRGDVFLADGRYVAGPAPSDLWTYQARVADGRVHVGDPVEPTGRSSPEQLPVDAGPVCHDYQADTIDYDAVVLHDWPVDRSTLRSPEEAVAEPSGTWTLIEGYLVIGPSRAGPTQVCSQVVGEQPPRCPDGSPSAAPGSQPASQAAWVHHGVMRAWVDDVTGFRRLEALTLETIAVHDPDGRSRNDARELGNATRVTVEDRIITVPAVDIFYGQPPDAALPAATYQLRLDNHGDIDHTLTSDALGVDLRANPGSTDSTTVRLPPGRHTFYCRIPGHREAGMELHIQVE